MTGGISWQKENYKKYTENTSGIVIKVKDKAGNIADYAQTVSISNIDKKGPEIQIDTNVTSNTITVEITNITDGIGAGVDETKGYTYYIATSKEGLNTAEGETLISKTKTFEGVSINSTYYIKIEARDKLGNIGTIIKTAAPGALNIDADTLTITNPIWKNKQATVTINNTDITYAIEYQIVREGETLDIQGGTWQISRRSSVNVTELKSGDIVYARLTDEEENKSGMIQKDIIDNTPPTIEVDGLPSEWTKENVRITINASDLESGLTDKAYSFDRRNFMAKRKL